MGFVGRMGARDESHSEGAAAGFVNELRGDFDVAMQAVGGASPVACTPLAHRLAELRRRDVEDAEPHRHVALAAVVQEGGDQEVARLRCFAQAAHDLEGVTLVATLHGLEQSSFGLRHEAVCVLEVIGRDARPQGVVHLPRAVERSRGCRCHR